LSTFGVVLLFVTSARTSSGAAFFGRGWCQADLLELRRTECAYPSVVENCYVIRFVAGNRELLFSSLSFFLLKADSESLRDQKK
jgi:hypothetical protein